MLMFLSFLRVRINVLTKGTFKSQIFFFVNRIEFDSICLKKLILSSYRETTYYCVSCQRFFFDRNIADLAIMKLKPCSILCVLGGFASSLSRHFAYRASGKIELATAITFF